MDALSLVAASALSLALVVLAAGVAWRVVLWVRTPNPLPIALAPAPRTRLGVAVRLAAELLAFRSLARASPVTWLGAILLHYGLLVVLLAHLRLLLPVLPAWLVPPLLASGWATFALLAGAGLLAVRRVAVDRLRWISTPSDHLHLLLLAAIALSGAALKRLWPTDLYRVGEFLRGVLTLEWQALPAHTGLLLHLALVVALLLVFPFSKLVHAPGIAFAPTWSAREAGEGGRRPDRDPHRSGGDRSSRPPISGRP